MREVRQLPCQLVTSGRPRWPTCFQACATTIVTTVAGGRRRRPQLILQRSAGTEIGFYLHLSSLKGSTARARGCSGAHPAADGKKPKPCGAATITHHRARAQAQIPPHRSPARPGDAGDPRSVPPAAARPCTSLPPSGPSGHNRRLLSARVNREVAQTKAGVSGPAPGGFYLAAPPSP